MGITPAYAGKSTSIIVEIAAFKDHPRLCGEKSTCKSFRRDNRGSPPPMRGKELKNPYLNAIFRITPAYAGKRARNVLKSIILQGSPPPMRGKVHLHPIIFQTFWITPAYAGKRHEMC